jgi:hypothetical protein
MGVDIVARGRESIGLRKKKFAFNKMTNICDSGAIRHRNIPVGGNVLLIKN